MSKRKGSRTERELFHILWEAGFATVRAAGSGSTTRPAPDLLSSNGKESFAIECKAVKGKKKYFSKEEIEQLNCFANNFNAQALIAIRFDNIGWYIISSTKIPQTKKESYVLSLEILQKEGEKINDFLQSKEKS